MSDVIELIKELEYAKHAVTWLLGNEAGSVDFHDIVYWASEVKRLREEIKKAL